MFVFMRKNILIILAVVFIVAGGCRGQVVKLIGKNPQGDIISIREVYFEGNAGQHRIEIAHGKSLYFCSDGSKIEMFFVNGVQYGDTTTWWPNGEVCSVVPFSEGMADGEARYMDEHGKLLKKSRFTKGTGIEYCFSPEGKLLKQKKWQDGKIIEVILHGVCASDTKNL